MKKIYHDKEVIIWQRKTYTIPDNLSTSEIVSKILNNELEPDSFKYINAFKEYDGREEIFDDSNQIMYSE